MTKPALKICCVKSLEEALLALNAGADLIGLVSEMPNGPGVISLAEISEIIRALPAETKTVLLTSKTTANEIVAQQKQTLAWGVQVVGHISFGGVSKRRTLLPEVTIIRVVHVADAATVDIASSYFETVDYLLLDSGSPLAKPKSLGGTGHVHDWNISRQICELSPVPVLLAGGIHVGNLLDACAEVTPSGIDLCSGLRTNDSLDPDKVAAFISVLDQLDDNSQPGVRE
ncbi:MAG: phosphoribosylanthranilate isomerase [Candidatus Marinimicrobia bacterium]|nr:phosphoribosylanthranilate isomerase [Candidatus Neomarinimicrobiota bacterium]MCF7903766.1 phosphoribosylanthranilate isomerase [Candidatus Neomarinimicrobiota bacterium]